VQQVKGRRTKEFEICGEGVGEAPGGGVTDVWGQEFTTSSQLKLT